MPSLQETYKQIERTYRKRTPYSADWHTRAQRVMPGGDTRSSTYFEPYPTVIERSAGAYLYDMDGNVLLDFLNNYTALVHGNAFAPVLEAAQKQIEKGTAWAAPNEHQLELAELLCRRVPSVAQLRFTNSGTEATMLAIRAARAFTGRAGMIKIEGGYHGTHDTMAVSIEPDPAQSGSGDAPLSVAAGAGVSQNTLHSTRVVPFNHTAALEQALVENRGKVAAVILEPVMGSRGMIPAEPEFLKQARELTRANDVLLILDEVMTFRLDTGGAQALYGVQPDLTAFAKIIGGGFPVGAFGGREDIMRFFDPVHGSIGHGGTFNANPVTMAAGLAALKHLTAEKIAMINGMGDTLRGGLRDVLVEQGIRGQITGMGSLVGVHLTPQPVRDYRSAASVRPILREMLHLACLNRGLFFSPEGVLNTSGAMGDSEINRAIEIFQDAIQELRPAIEAECPELLE
jgi:glutamate-1-semialdehyde 2,1-aminomutase